MNDTPQDLMLGCYDIVKGDLIASDNKWWRVESIRNEVVEHKRVDPEAASAL